MTAMRDKLILTDCDGVLLDWEFGFTDWMRRKGYHLSEHYLGKYAIEERYDGLTKSGAKTLVREFNNSAEMLSLSPLSSSIKYIILWGCLEGDRCREPARNRPMAEQQGGEFTSSVPTTRAGDAALQTNAKFADVRLRPRLGPKPFQPGTPPLLTTKFQTEPCCRSRRVARSRRSIRDSHPVLA